MQELRFLDTFTGSLSDGIKSSDSNTDSKVKPICGWVAPNSDYVIVFENGMMRGKFGDKTHDQNFRSATPTFAAAAGTTPAAGYTNNAADAAWEV